MDVRPSFVIPRIPTSPDSIAHLLSSNFAPEVLDSRVTSTHISELESQLAALEDFMALCSSHRADLLRSIVAHKSILSPMRRLPNELLAEIFMVVVRDAFYDKDSGPMSEYPWILTRVCKRWTAVALGTQSLWSWVFLDLNATGARVPRAVPTTQLFHERSGTSPPMIKLVQENEKQMTRDIFNVALTHAERWQNLNLSLAGGSLLALALDVRGRLHTLTALKIKAEMGNRQTKRELGLTDSFATAPNLTAVHMRISGAQSDSIFRPPFSLPWHQLTRLSSTFTSDKEALSILPQLSRIVELHLIFSEVLDVQPSQSPVTLAFLRSLEVMMRKGSSYHVPHSFFFDHLTCPMLEHLTAEGTLRVDTVLHFIERSDCSGTLDSFHCLLDFINVPVALSLVYKLPHLSTLQIGDFKGEAVYKFIGLVRTLHSHWLQVVVRDHSHSGTSDPELSVRLVDRELSAVALEEAKIETLSNLQADGLFIEIHASLHLDSVVDAKFE